MYNIKWKTKYIIKKKTKSWKIKLKKKKIKQCKNAIEEAHLTIQK